VPDDEASSTQQFNPHLVARVVDWTTHDLNYKGVFDVQCAGPGTEDVPTLRFIVATHIADGAGAEEIPTTAFKTQYQKAWYHLLAGAASIVTDGEYVQNRALFHASVGAALDSLRDMTSSSWQGGVSRLLLAMREISLAHDAGIHGRLCYYTEAKEQNLYLPLGISNY